MIIWVLTDNRVGSNNQSIAIAEKLSRYYVIKNIVYDDFFILLPNFIRRSSLIGINQKDSSDIKSDLPDIIICAGRRLSTVALNIKKRTKNKAFIINIMNPNLNFNKFDLVLLPYHDKTSKIFLKQNNVVETTGSLTRINDAKIKEEVDKWKNFFKDYNKPLVFLMIGGDTKEYSYDPKDFGLMISNLSNIVNKISGTLLITTSRRTSTDCVEQLRKKINCDYYLYDWKWENDERNIRKNPLGNPYYALLGLADFLVVTADSMSMVSECCSTGKPTYIYMPKKSISKKHHSFCESLIIKKTAREFNKDVTDLEAYIYTPLDELNRIMKIIIKKLEERK